MAVIGIDPGTAITGYGIVAEEPAGALSALAFGVIRTPKELSPEQRLAMLYAQLCDLVGQHQPESAAVERLFFQRNTRTAFAVGEARGVALLALAQAGVPVYEYSPNDVKQAVSGYGRASKGQVQEMMCVLLGLARPPSPDDAADALAVAICHLHGRRMRGLA